MPRREAVTRAAVILWAKRRGIRHIRQSMRPGVRAGIPDDQFLFPVAEMVKHVKVSGLETCLQLPCGVSVFIEFKSEGKRPGALQYQRIKELKDDGFFADWFDEPGAAITFLAQALDALTLYAARGVPFDEQVKRWASAPPGRPKDVDHA